MSNALNRFSVKHIASSAGSRFMSRINEWWWAFWASFYLLVTVSLLIAAIYAFSTYPLIAAGVMLALLVGGAGVITFLSFVSEYSGQNARDLKAQDILSAIQSGEKVPKFTLYLRPFASTDEIQAQEIPAVLHATQGFSTLALSATSAKFELERQIERSVRHIGPLVALGAPLEHLGAGRIPVSDDSWREAINLLMENARLIFLLPSSREGTLWEVNRILSSDVIKRTVIIDPPNTSRLNRGREYDHRVEWSDIQDAFAKHGYVLPEENKTGALIYFGDTPKHPQIQNFSLKEKSGVRKFVRRAFAYRLK